ncbi:MAG TPA: hypothetical protein VH062_11935 [Polyangiaceae bacterium]|jgi:hypothetical protein|nr:hypothetical protein [Polyangiaceae bacterium]
MKEAKELVQLLHPWIDGTRAPLYAIQFPQQAADEEVASFCQVRERWAVTAKYKVAWVVDLAGVIQAPATQRRIFSDHLQRFEPHDVAYNQGSALIAPNAFVRGIITAVFWLKAPRFPSECFTTQPEALAWASAQLAARPSGVPSSSKPSSSKR